MKKAKFIIVAVLLSSVAFLSGCTKERLDSRDGILAFYNGNQPIPAEKGNVHYRLQTIPSSSDNPFQWNAGRMNAVELLFNATLMVTPPTPFSTAASIHQSVGLGVLTELGVVHPNTGGYENLIFQVRLNGADTGYSMVLTGTYNQSGTLLPVRVIVSQSVLLQGQWPSAKILPPSSKEHVATLYMDINRLTAGINPDLIRQAFAGANPDTETLISSETNGQLFQAFVQNMQARDGLKVSFD